MTENVSLQREQIRTALAELDRLALDEYGVSLESLLLSHEPISAQRVRRVVGVVLKRKFAKSTTFVPYSMTGARRSWPWPDLNDSLVPIEPDAANELALFEQLRLPGPWNRLKQRVGTSADEVPVPWRDFKHDADQERGLFTVLALYAVDKLKKAEPKNLEAYLEATESKSFEAGLDLATLLFDTGVIGPLAALLGVPTLAVGVALVGVRYTYRALADPNEGDERDKDN